jgi:hypothetical protein
VNRAVTKLRQHRVAGVRPNSVRSDIFSCSLQSRSLLQARLSVLVEQVDSADGRGFFQSTPPSVNLFMRLADQDVSTSANCMDVLCSVTNSSGFSWAGTLRNQHKNVTFEILGY